MPFDLDDVARPGRLSAVERVKQKHEDRLLAIDGVEMIGTGRGPIGDPVILLYLRDASVRAKVPQEIDGYPVETEVTGEFDAFGTL